MTWYLNRKEENSQKSSRDQSETSLKKENSICPEVIELLLNKNDKLFPDIAVVITDVENLKRNLLLFTQIKDLEIPTILVINMADRMKSKGISLNISHLEEQLKTKIVLVSTRKGYGIEELKNQIVDYKSLSTEPCLNASSIDEEYFNKLNKL